MTTRMTTARTLDRLTGLGLTLAAFILYLLTLAPTVLEADGGEFQFVPWLPGIAHPTGYPLYLLLGWLWTHLLPFGEVAWRMNLLSAVLAAIAVGLTYALARSMLNLTLPETPLAGRILAAVLTAAAFATSRTFWSQAIVAEVYALHALLVALVLWLTLNQRYRLAALAFGLGLAHHRTMILLLPALSVYLLWREIIEPRRREGRQDFIKLSLRLRGSFFKIFIPLIFLVMAPLLLYLYLPLVAPHTPYATLTLSDTQTLTLYENSWRGFWQHVTGAVFSHEVQPAAVGIDRLRLVWDLLLAQVGWPGVILALTGLVTLWQRRRFDLLVLTGLSALAFTGFNLVYFIGDVEVLFIPVWLLVCLWLGLGSLSLAHWLAAGFVRRKSGVTRAQPAFAALEQRLGQNIYRLQVIIFVGLCFLGLSFQAIRNSQVSQAHNTAARERWQQILAEPIPHNAILLSNDRNEIMPLWYYQYVEGRRPDLAGLFPLIVPDPAYANVGRVLDQALASGRPIYLIKPMDGLSLKADLLPVGSQLFQAAAYTPLPADHPCEIIFTNQTETIKLLGYDMSPAQPRPGEPVTLTLYWQVEQPLLVDYTSYVHLLDSAGQGITQSDHVPGGDFYPSHYWQSGEVLRDRHILTMPAATGLYRLRVGLYYQPQPGTLIGLGSDEEIGQLAVASK